MKFEHSVSLSVLLESNNENPNGSEIREKLLKVIYSLSDDEIKTYVEIFDTEELD